MYILLAVITLEGVGKCLRKNWQVLQFGTAFFSSMLFNSGTKVTQRICVVHCWGVSIGQLLLPHSGVLILLRNEGGSPDPGAGTPAGTAQSWSSVRKFGPCVFHRGLVFFPNLSWESVITMKVQLFLLRVAAKWSVEFWRRWLLIIMIVSPRVDLLLPILAT